jgi:GNAT superfamily N-acetyltransferase
MAYLTPPRPLTSEDDRLQFDCGRDSLNAWFRRHAWNNQLGNVSRTSVVCEAADGAVAGFVALSAAQIERAFVAKSDQRNRPDAIPAVLLGQLAVDLRFRRIGLGQSLLAFALSTAVRLSQEIGCFGVITHPLDDDLRHFYGRSGFETLPFDPRGGMVARIVDLQRAGFRG